MKGELSITQKQGIVSILPKAGKAREFLKNWRPISLLNVSYKIASACIANRIKTVLDYLIHGNQKGFLKNRFISENTRIIYDVLHEAQNRNIPGIVLLIDFEKAFDSISWKFMYKTLKFFNFGPDLIKWINVLYNEAQLCVIQNGIFSQFFKIGRGCRQGDPVSPYIFNLCVEIMGYMIRQNKNIKGIKIGKEKICLLQYADDTVLFLDGSEKSLKSSLDLLFQFSKFSGLKPNITKTKALWIGSKVNSTNTLCNETGLQWIEEPFTVLGITFTADLKNIIHLNFDKCLQCVRKEIQSWSKRNISPIGKITIIKSLLLSKFVHLFTVLPQPDKKWIQELEKLFYNFIWNSRIEKISRKTMQLSKENGGLKMTNIEFFIKSLKLTWFRRLFNTNSEWISLFTEVTKCNSVHLSHFGPEYSKFKAKNTNNSFWKEVLNIYSDFLKNLSCDSSTRNFLVEPLWYNNKIIIQNRYVFSRSLYEKGFTIVDDLLDDNGNFLSYEDIAEKFCLKIPFTFYEGIKRAIRHSWPNVQNQMSNPISRPLQPDFIKILNKKGSRAIYKVFLSSTQCYRPKCESKWTTELKLKSDFDWKQIHRKYFSITKDTRLIWFNFRIIHRTLGTNRYLFLSKIRDNDLCSLCQMETETILHVFYFCPNVCPLWNLLENWIFEKSRKRIKFDACTIILGNPREDEIINLIILLVKRYIFLMKNQNLSFLNVVKYLKAYYELEGKLYKTKNETDVYTRRWLKWKCLF